MSASGSKHKDWDIRCKVYIGNLGPNASRIDLEREFIKFGSIKNLWIARNPPGFAFIEYEDPRDAMDAVQNLDGTRICGARIKVEMSNGKSRVRYNDDRYYRQRMRSRSNSPPRYRYSRSRSRSRTHSRGPPRRSTSRSLSIPNTRR